MEEALGSLDGLDQTYCPQRKAWADRPRAEAPLGEQIDEVPVMRITTIVGSVAVALAVGVRVADRGITRLRIVSALRGR